MWWSQIVVGWPSRSLPVRLAKVFKYYNLTWRNITQWSLTHVTYNRSQQRQVFLGNQLHSDSDCKQTRSKQEETLLTVWMPADTCRTVVRQRCKWTEAFYWCPVSPSHWSTGSASPDLLLWHILHQLYIALKTLSYTNNEACNGWATSHLRTKQAAHGQRCSAGKTAV